MCVVAHGYRGDTDWEGAMSFEQQLHVLIGSKVMITVDRCSESQFSPGMHWANTSVSAIFTKIFVLPTLKFIEFLKLVNFSTAFAFGHVTLQWKRFKKMNK